HHRAVARMNPRKTKGPGAWPGPEKLRGSRRLPTAAAGEASQTQRERRRGGRAGHEEDGDGRVPVKARGIRVEREVDERPVERLAREPRGDVDPAEDRVAEDRGGEQPVDAESLAGLSVHLPDAVDHGRGEGLAADE